jgi:hypothetical protein
MKTTLLFLIGFICLTQCIAQQNAINKELNFTLKFLVENDTIAVSKEYSIIVNGLLLKDNSGHQGGRKENFIRTDRKGNFKLYIINPGEYEFIILGKGSVKKKIENIIDYTLFVPLENK